MWKRSGSLKRIWREWHIERQRARETAPNLVPFGDIEKTAYDLDTADVTGKDYNKNFQWNPTHNEIDGTPNHGVDVRELDRR